MDPFQWLFSACLNFQQVTTGVFARALPCHTVRVAPADHSVTTTRDPLARLVPLGRSRESPVTSQY